MVKTRKTFKCNLTIDGEKLLKEIEKRGLTKGEVAAEVGKSSSYINTCVADKSIAPPVMKLLDLLYNIKYDDIKPDSTGGGYRQTNFRGSWSGHGRAPGNCLSRV